ncbi:hypothetical protein HanPSC8_Chr05g0192901 [Helianthus annuus]|nr:hypothetical protein HanPSC8_Chr05g0192901 [Helianthus annuus]
MVVCDYFLLTTTLHNCMFSIYHFACILNFYFNQCFKIRFLYVPNLAQKRLNRVYWAVQPGVSGGLTGSTGQINQPI